MVRLQNHVHGVILHHHLDSLYYGLIRKLIFPHP